MKKYALLTLVLLAGCVVRTAPSVPVSTPTAPKPTVSTTVNTTILFAEDDARLTDAAIAQLTASASILAASNQSIQIEGHAEETGSREYNLGLGAQRAAAVRNYLVSKGIANSRMSISTVGNEKPAQSCGSAACDAQNRRVLIIAR